MRYLRVIVPFMRVCACCGVEFESKAPRQFCGTSYSCADYALCKGRCARPGDERRATCECCGAPIEAGSRGPVRRFCRTGGYRCPSTSCTGLCGGSIRGTKSPCREPGCEVVTWREWCQAHELRECTDCGEWFQPGRSACGAPRKRATRCEDCRKRPAGEWQLVDGYYRRSRNGRVELQHRVVMEELLGRELLPGESVHHKNGRQDDNRPENLELWVRPQPTGQRVEDLVEWVVERYRPIVEEALRG